MDGKQIIIAIHERQQALGMSVSEFCREAKMSRTHYYRIFEAGKKPALHLACEMARVVGLGMTIGRQHAQEP